jgi:glycine dehydrogenase subunit 1
VVVSRLIHPDKLSKMVDYCRPNLNVRVVGHEAGSGLLDLNALENVLGEDVAAVYLDNPCFLGHIETRGQDIADLTHQCGAEYVVGVDPVSLGVLTPPAAYGADIVSGDLQPLGMHLSFGGGHAGFIATRDEERYVMEYPSRLFGIAPTRVEGEYGFGDVAYHRTSFAVREEGKEWVGTAAALWGITAGVYLALMGPHGMAELGKGLMERARYAQAKLSEISNIRCPVFEAVPFQEFVVDFSKTGHSVVDINDGLLDHGIFGGLDVGTFFPEHNNCALYCVSEVHSRADIDRLAQALREVLK